MLQVDLPPKTRSLKTLHPCTGDMRVISTLRLLRAFRVVRIFRRLQSARRIITAIVTSIEPVCNVLVVVLGIACVFAMFGATA